MSYCEIIFNLCIKLTIKSICYLATMKKVLKTTIEVKLTNVYITSYIKQILKNKS